MQKLIAYVNNMIRHTTEVLYYIREEDYQTMYELSLSFIKKIEIFIKMAHQMQCDESINLLQNSYETLKRQIKSFRHDKDSLKAIEKIYSREFIKQLSNIEMCYLEKFNWKIKEHDKINMQILYDSNNKYNKKLYNIVKADKRNIPEKYEMSITKTGDITLLVNTYAYGKVKICSSGNPWQEAMLYISSFKPPNKIKNIFVLGFGLGYHIQCLAKKYSQSNIIVLENDLFQIKIAMKYRDLSEMFLNGNVKIIYCEKPKDYVTYLKKIGNIYEKDTENSVLFKTWKPSIKTILEDNLRDTIENYQLLFESMERMESLLDENFVKNIALEDDYVDDISEKLKGKNIIIVAGGASLDDNIYLLRQIVNDAKYHVVRNKIKIICVGKVSKKLIKERIIPDYIIITDAKHGTKWQLSGIENSGIPLIYISTAAANVVADYHSKRYIVYQNGMPEAERMATAKQLKLYNSGGSVTTLAIDIAIRHKAKRIICIGVDMGYKGEDTHARGVGKKIINKDILREVDAVGGGKILTSKTLDIYRKWIEKRIISENSIEFINSSSGAKINGMKEIGFRSILEHICEEK